MRTSGEILESSRSLPTLWGVLLIIIKIDWGEEKQWKSNDMSIS
jgi:hypothetical protein